MKKYIIGFCLLLFTSFLFLSSQTGSLQRIIQDETAFLKSIRKQFDAFYEVVKEEVIYVQTDKTLYIPGEHIWFSVFVRDEKSLMPSQQSDIVHAELITPKGNVAAHLRLVAKDGVAPGDFFLSGDQPGGVYTLRVYSRWQKNNPDAVIAERKITVQQMMSTRLLFTLDFVKRAYGPGDKVEADIQVKTPEGAPFSRQMLSCIVNTEGVEWRRSTVMTNDSGIARIQVTLPQTLVRADGLLTVTGIYDGLQESITRTIPIVLQDMQVQFFPEGGDWVVGQKSRVAFRAVNGFGKAADIEGVIEDEQGRVIQNISSYHFGMGSFVLQPDSGIRYALRITRPEGISGRFFLPDPVRLGYGMQIDHQGQQIRLSVFSPFHETLQLIGQVRGQIVLSKGLRLTKGLSQYTFDVSSFPQGVAVFTLFDSKGMERAERLVFLGRTKGMKISLQTDKTNYLPREKVTLQVRTTDGDGLPAPMDLLLSVTDQQWLRMADDRQGNLMARIFLEPYLSELPEEPDFYFQSNHPKAEKAMELLMLTSGWRKYSWKTIRENRPEVVHPAERAVFSGFVREGQSGKPVAGAVLRFAESGIRTESDINGAFTFSKVDLSENRTLEVKAGNFAPVTLQIDEYQVQFPVYLYPRYFYTERTKGVRADQLRGVRNNVAEGLIPMAADAMMEKNTIVEDMAVAEEKAGEAKNEMEPEFGPAIPGWKPANLRRPAPEAPAQVFSGYYKHKEFPVKLYKTVRVDSVRDDYRRTIYWNGHVKTDAYGKARVVFSSGDLLSSWRVLAEGFSNTGSPGTSEFTFSTQLPVSVEAKIPNAITSGDKLEIPVVIKNTSAKEYEVSVRTVLPNCLRMNTSSSVRLSLPGKQSKVFYINAEAIKADTGAVQILVEGEGISESFSAVVRVSPRGFPVVRSFSGQSLSQEFTFRPEKVVSGSMDIQFTAYPNILTQLMSGVESILREPYGCFEQTSSSNYPNIIALDYLRTSGQINPKLEARCLALLDDGYKKLVSFETRENGYEWFGASPAHEALTAYGLMEFVDMKKVYPAVDDAMIGRTRKLLLDRRDGQGGFKRNPRALDAFGAADEDITNAYIVYSLSEAGERDIEKEVRSVVRNVKETRDPYTLALAANACFNLQDKRTGMELLDILHKTQYDGYWTGRKHSITRSTGKSLHVETTALVLMAMMHGDPLPIEDINSAVKFLVSSNTGYGGFGSTQATVLALKALTRFTVFSKKTDESGVIEVYINGQKRAERSYVKGETKNIIIEGLSSYIGNGDQQILVKYRDCKQALPFAMAVKWNTTQPDNHPEAPIKLEMNMTSASTRVGETNRLTAIVRNNTRQGQPMTLAQLALPAGFSVSPVQLRQMMEEKQFDFYEITGQQLAIYWRALAPAESRTIQFDLKAELPGIYEAQASSICLYYTPEKKVWTNTSPVRILP